MKTKILMMLLFCQLLVANSYSLKEFSKMVSQYNNLNVYIDEDINSSVSLYVPDKITDKDILKLFEISLSKNHFNLKRFNNNLYVSKKIPFDTHFYTYKLKYNTSLDCKALLDFHRIPYTYLKDTSTFLISTTEKKYKEVLQLLQTTDQKKKQVTLKITIFEYSEGDIKERGISSFSKEESMIVQGEETSQSYVTKLLSTIIAPVSSSTLTYKSSDFNMALSFLDTENMIEIKQSPYILARNNDKFNFQAVTNIPFKTTTTTTESANTSTNESINYKDVGLKIDGIAFIYDDYVSLDLSLIVEDIISQSQDNIPQTYKRELKSLSNVNYGDVLLLSGLKRTKREINDYSIPYLSSIPWLGSIFQYTNESETELNIAISIEVLEIERGHSVLDLRELANEIKAE